MRIGETEFFDDAGDFAELTVGIEEYGEGVVRGGASRQGEHQSQKKSGCNAGPRTSGKPHTIIAHPTTPLDAVGNTCGV